LTMSFLHKSATPAGLFDDVVKSKGRGLVISLFGPSGVGKTLSCEALCEVARLPLWVVSIADVGVVPEQVETQLETVFSIATAWEAVVLIDEADVFLECREVTELSRNAMVSTFIRHIEYFPGIVILSTNRVTVFDPAVYSRIHVSLNYEHLAPDAEERIWRAFLERAGMVLSMKHDDFIKSLVQTPRNGREIKNVVRTAAALAMSAGEPLDTSHIARVVEFNLEAKLDLNASQDVQAHGSFKIPFGAIVTITTWACFVLALLMYTYNSWHNSV